MFITHLNHVFNVEVLNISSDGSLNAGNTIVKGFTADVKSVGSQSIIGNALFRPATNGNFNFVADPDAVDQAQRQL